MMWIISLSSIVSNDVRTKSTMVGRYDDVARPTEKDVAVSIYNTTERASGSNGHGDGGVSSCFARCQNTNNVLEFPIIACLLPLLVITYIIP
mmetsp:Transcript_27036/g.49797  ORF Transcript_27036/g.49797 Transcript_27036/m.49797 type:complete len:92 (-) Transcript_27036:62-337(-)